MKCEGESWKFSERRNQIGTLLLNSKATNSFRTRPVGHVIAYDSSADSGTSLSMTTRKPAVLTIST